MTRPLTPSNPDTVSPTLIVDLAKGYGGAEVRVLDLARALHDQWPYAIATLQNSPLHQRLNAAGLHARPVPYGKGDPRQLLFFRKLIAAEGFTTLDTHNVQSQFWGNLAARMAGIRHIATVHSAYRLEHNNSGKGKLYEQVLRLNYRWHSHFIAVSKAVDHYLQNIGIPTEAISLIHNAFYPSSNAPVGRNYDLFRNLGWGADKFVIIIVARLEPVKAHDVFLKALATIIKDYPNVRALFVGEGRTRATLETDIEALHLGEIVHLAGFRNDVPALLSGSDLFCLPSHSEGLPYALLEACGYQLPLLVSRVGGMAEILTDGETARLVAPGDPAALANGLRWMLDNRTNAQTMGHRAARFVAQTFNPATMINDTLNLYHPNRAGANGATG